MTMKQLKKLILLSLVPVLTTGCIKEDMDDCENVAICFRYKADGDKDVLRQYMDKIDLYVFDANNRLVDQRTYNQDALNPAQEAPSFTTPRHLQRGGSGKRLRQNPGEGHQLHRPLTNLHTASQLGHSLRSGRARPQLHGKQANHRARQQQVPA